MPDSIETQMTTDARLPSELDAVDRRARLVARTWHRNEKMEPLLAYRGINLGTPLEQVLVHDLIPVFAETAKRDGA